jgi:hypothetical protein
MPGGWITCAPSGFHGTTFAFSQGEEFPWMETSELTKGGCCLAMTIRFFDQYNPGADIADYFAWVKSKGGVADIIKTQSVYINHSRSGGAFFSALKAVARMTEDDTLTSLGYSKVHGPWFPTLAFSELPLEATREFDGEPCLFKMMYLSKLPSGEAHAMGIILDDANHVFIFFDPNEGAAVFPTINDMRQWLVTAVPKYDSDWSGYYMDTWKH